MFDIENTSIAANDLARIKEANKDKRRVDFVDRERGFVADSYFFNTEQEANQFLDRHKNRATGLHFRPNRHDMYDTKEYRAVIGPVDRQSNSRMQSGSYQGLFLSARRRRPQQRKGQTTTTWLDRNWQ
jgi:hypothetical protein